MAYATAFNGGRSQTNFNFMQTGGEYFFLNLLKEGQEWSYIHTDTGSVSPLELDTDGYLNDASVITAHGGVATRFFIPSQAARPGIYVVTWSGNGTIYCPFSHTAASGYTGADKTSTTGSGRYEFTPSTQQIDFGIEGVGSPHITNLRFFHKDDEAALDAGLIFGTQLKARLAEGNFGVHRFMNQQANNTSNITNWASLKPTSYVFYQGSEFRANLWAGVATLSGTQYSVAAPSKRTDGTNWTGLVDKATVHVKFGTAYQPLVATFNNGSANITVTAHGLTVNAKLYINAIGAVPTNFTKDTQLYHVVSVPNANTITVATTQGGTAIIAGSAHASDSFISPFLTLNVGSTGDINILDGYATPFSLGGNAYPVTGKMATLVYEESLNAWVKFGGDVAQGAQGIINGVPPTVLFELSAQLGAHPWFMAPTYACDPATDFMPTLMAYCRDNAPSWMIPRFEGPNELWNTAGGFRSTTYATAKAVAYGWSGYNDWYGKIMSVLGQQAAIVYGYSKAQVKTQSRYQVILGAQTANVGGSAQRAESQAYMDQAAAAQSPYIKDRACGWVTHLCIAQYWNPGHQDSEIETEFATAYANTLQTNIAYAFARSAMNANSAKFGTVPDLAAVYQNWKAWCLARSTPIMNMCGYEGCYSPDYYGDANINRLKHASRACPETYGQLIAVYKHFTDQTDSAFTAEFPSNFILGDNDGPTAAIANVSNFIWSVFQGDIYATPTPQWYAICAYNSVGDRATNPRLRLHT